jgi:hypothetical protein
MIVQAQATAAGVWRDEISRWQRPPVFRQIMSFVDWTTQWTCVERVSKGWQESCAEVGGCAVASFPSTTTSENLRVVKRHHLGLLQLELNGCELSEDGLTHIAALVNLQSLGLGACRNLTAEGLFHLTALSNLLSLNLNGCTNLTDEGLSHLRSLSNLRSLDVGACTNLKDSLISAGCPISNR